MLYNCTELSEIFEPLLNITIDELIRKCIKLQQTKIYKEEDIYFFEYLTLNNHILCDLVNQDKWLINKFYDYHDSGYDSY